MSESTALEPFDYGSLDEHTRLLVQQKTAETHGLLIRTAESIIAIGDNLLAVQKLLPEMKFSAWLRTEFDLSRQSAYNCMRVATRFGGSCTTVLQLPASVLYELASSSEAIVAQVEQGHLPATTQAIKAAREAERQAREAERQVRAELQTQQAEARRLTSDLEEMRRQIADMAAPEVQIREVEKPIVPPEVTAQLHILQQKVSTLTQQREQLSQELLSLQEQINMTAAERTEDEQERQIRLNWYRITSEFQRSLRTALSQWPSSLDVLAFEAEDWTRLSQVKELTRRFQEACMHLTDSSQTHIVDGSAKQEDV